MATCLLLFRTVSHTATRGPLVGRRRDIVYMGSFLNVGVVRRDETMKCGIRIRLTNKREFCPNYPSNSRVGCRSGWNFLSPTPTPKLEELNVKVFHNFLAHHWSVGTMHLSRSAAPCRGFALFISCGGIYTGSRAPCQRVRIHVVWI